MTPSNTDQVPKDPDSLHYSRRIFVCSFDILFPRGLCFWLQPVL